MSMDASSDALWLGGRFHPDLPSEAEFALRRAGLLYHDDVQALAELARAEALAPNHLAVGIARYRYHFYKHQYVEAERFARECLRQVGRKLGLPEHLNDVDSRRIASDSEDPDLRFWLFAWQAYGYVLLRLGRESEGMTILGKLAALDTQDLTKTQVLLEVLRRAGDED